MSTILDRTKQKKVDFDVTQRKHVMVYLHWRKFQRWPGDGRCPFNLRFPYGSVPAMIESAMIEHAYRKQLEEVELNAKVQAIEI